MEMRKKDMQDGINRLQKECTSTISYFETLLAKQTDAMEKFNKMSNKELIKNNKKFVDVYNKQFQYLQKVLTLNMELEVLTMDEEMDNEEETDFRVSSVSLSEPKLTSNKLNSSMSNNLLPTVVDESTSNINEELMAPPEPVVAVEQKNSGSSIVQKLEGHKSRIDTVRMQLPVPHMPDLQFRSSSVTSSMSSEYFSAPEKSTSVNKHKKKNKQKKLEGKIEIKDPVGPKTNEQCFISSYISPAEFYINIVNEELELLFALPDEITVDANKKAPFSSKAEAFAAIKQICVVYSSEYQTWYRAQVVDWLMDLPTATENVYIQFLDYGDYKVVHFTDLRTIQNVHCKCPKFAIKCKLAHLYPKDMVWSEDVRAYFDEIMNAGTHFKIVHVDSDKADIYGVELIDVNEDNQENTIGQHLINTGMAVEELFTDNEVIKSNFMKKQIKAAQGMAGIHVNMTDQEVFDRYYENMQTTEESTLDKALTGYNAKDEERRCPFTRRDGTCFKGRNCKLEHFLLRKDGYTTDKVPVFTSAMKELPVSKAGDQLKIFITTVNGINNFYATIRDYDPNGIQLKAMVEEINRPEIIRQLKSFEIMPAIGEIVVAKHWDGRWYRARVLDVDTVFEKPDTVMRVFFVDFGETLHVDFKDIKQIEERHLDFPFQAVRCSIHNIKINENKPGGKDFFESRYLCNTYTAVVKYVGYQFISILLTDAEQIDIGQTLIDNGFAISNDTWCYPAEDQLLID